MTTPPPPMPTSPSLHDRLPVDDGQASGTIATSATGGATRGGDPRPQGGQGSESLPGLPEPQRPATLDDPEDWRESVESLAATDPPDEHVRTVSSDDDVCIDEHVRTVSSDDDVCIDGHVRTVSFTPQTNETNGGYYTRDLPGSIQSGDWLDSQTFPPLRFVVDGIIPEGFTIIAGAPKTGKSWFVAGLGLAAAAGREALGHIPVKQRDVLYLALEDGDRRLQARARQIMAGSPIPAAFHRALRIPPGQAGELIAAWLDNLGTQRATRSLVVVDTAQKARPPTSARVGAYEADYRFGGAIKSLADAHPGMAIIAVHHTRKARSDDFVESASGTNGLTGAADTIIVLERERNTDTGTLHVTGRDVEENAYQIQREGHGWILTGAGLDEARAAAEASRLTRNLGDLSTRIVTFIAEHPDCTPLQIKAAVEDPQGHVDQYLARMVESGRIARASRGHYRIVGADS